MKIGIVATDMPHQVEHAQAMAEGLGRHGIVTTIYPEHRTPSEDAVICWGWRIGNPLREVGKEVLLMERGYIQRNQFASLGWNGLNGRATRHWVQDGQERFLSQFPQTMQKWNPNGNYALIIGQVSGDESVKGIDMTGWYNMAVMKCREIGFRQIKFRPHPVALHFGQKDKVDGAQTHIGALSEALEKAALVVTYNSNTGVDALLAGKPTITCDIGAMAWPIASHTFDVQKEPDRRQWAARLAWSQFSLDEIRSGFAWDVVKDSRTLQ